MTKKKSLLVCFSQLRWGFVFQRPQHLMTLASDAYQVVFWEEPMFVPGIAPYTAIFPQNDNLVVMTPMLPEGASQPEIDSALKVLLDEMVAVRGPVGIAWYITPQMLTFSEHVRSNVTVYDNMDELSAFANAPAVLIELEEALLARADVVFTGGQSIFEAKRHRHANIHAFPSSIDKNHFGRGRVAVETEPTDQVGIAKPRIGWFGVIDERFDVDLVREVAAARPQWQFVMIGPIVKIDPATLPKADNIHWLGAKDYPVLPDYLSGWDAGFIPFAINESTRFISPTKTPEFLAAGVPVVATAIRDIVRPYGDRGLVQIATNPADAVEAFEHVMAMPKAPWITQVDQFLSDKSWQQTWADMNELIQGAIQKRKSALTEEAA